MTTDITKLAQREKFEAWFVNDVVGADVTFPAFEDGAYAEGEIYDEQFYFMLQAMLMAWKAAGAELVEALEKAQKSNAFLKGQLSELANFNPDWDKLEASYESWREIAAELLVAKERIAELESRTVTFKLPFTPEPSAFAPWVAKAFYQFHKDTVKSCVAIFSDACAVAGIKVEGG